MASCFLAPVARVAGVVAFSVTAAAAGPETASEHPPLWNLVAQSHMIIVGTPTVPVDQFEPAQRTGHGRYIDFDTGVQRCLKGDPCPQTMTTRYYIYADARESPVDRALVAANGKESVLFLLTGLSSNVGRSANYLAGHTAAAVQPASPDLIHDLKAEVAAQQEIVRRFGENFPPSNEPLYGKVKSLIEAMLNRRKQKKAFAELEALGKAAVPAMIMQMDDRRELPVKAISLRNPPGFFEGFRHYGPEVVADAIAAILNQITGESFGTMYNGASEPHRKAEIDAWRIYLHRTKFGEKNSELRRLSAGRPLPREQMQRSAIMIAEATNTCCASYRT